MNSKITLVVIILFSMAINSCKDEEEYNIELIPGDYIGDLYYWNAWGKTRHFSQNDFPKGEDIILSVKKTGSNYMISFEKSFIQNFPEIPKIPDLKIEITPKSLGVYDVTTLPGQTYKSLNKKDIYYNNQKDNLFYFYPHREVYGRLTLRSIHKDSIQFFEMGIHKID